MIIESIRPALAVSIPLFSASMILTALKSFPYSLMRDTVPRNKHGVTWEL